MHTHGDTDCKYHLKERRPLEVKPIDKLKEEDGTNKRKIERLEKKVEALEKVSTIYISFTK